jgi:hypothetical protein
MSKEVETERRDFVHSVKKPWRGADWAKMIGMR